MANPYEYMKFVSFSPLWEYLGNLCQDLGNIWMPANIVLLVISVIVGNILGCVAI